MLKKILVAVAVFASAAGGALIGATPAQADTAWGCSYPRVCFYKTSANWNNRTPTASYQDVTSGWQTLGSSSRGSNMIWNTRNDDVAYIHFTNGATECIRPNSGLYAVSVGTADKIRISTSATC